MKCLVTGAAGFIGNALVKRLIKEGYDVIGLIHEKMPTNSIKKVEYLTADITDISSLELVVKDVDIVFHCAAYVLDYGPWKKFYEINVQGTKNLLEISKKNAIKQFIFLSHIHYETSLKYSNYTKSKFLAEEFLINEYKKNKFPYVIIRPGNVFGPGQSVWVVRILKAIQQKRIRLIDQGNGIFKHTYVENLVDVLISAINRKEAIGKSFNITDGDYTITYKKYFDDLAKIAQVEPIEKNMSKKKALIICKIMIFFNKIFKIKPWVTPFVVSILTNQSKISIKKAEKILDYKPKITYKQAMINIEKWLKTEKLV